MSSDVTSPCSDAEHPLRIGILVDSMVQPAWIERIIADIQKSDIAEIVLVVLNDTPEPPVSSLQRLKKAVASPEFALYWIYQWTDMFLFSRASAGGTRIKATGEKACPDPFAARDIEPQIGGAARISVRPRQTTFSDYFPEDKVNEIRSYNLSVVLRFGFRILRGDALRLARHGVWSYHHADNMTNRGGPAGFWEVFERRPVTGSVLQVLTEDLDNGNVVYRSFASTDKYSVARNRTNYFWTSAAFVMRKLRDLHEGGPAALDTGSTVDYAPYSNRLYLRPRNREMAALFVRHALHVLASRVRRFALPGQWVLAYRLSSEVPALHRFKYLVPPPDRFWADPFPVERDGHRYIFFEESIEAHGRAHISVMEIHSDGSVTEPVAVLQRDYHLSYPFVFQWNGEFFMIPETVEVERIELYRCVDFPYHWEFDRVLLNGVRGVDATIVERSGRWWMFVNIAVDGARDFDELHLYTADTPLGSWRPHRRNPVKSDARSTRPAGRPFEWGGRLLRPAQDCGVRYGYAVSINAVVQMDDDDFKEEEISRIDPNWDSRVVATHTLNAVPGLTVVDALLLRRRPLRRRARLPKTSACR